VHPDTVLEPYDVRLGAGRSDNLQWAAEVQKQLSTELAGLENVTLVALAGGQYRTALRNVPWPVEVPMKGLGIGQQLGWLTGRLSA
jgi:hypothetical protein